MTNIYLKDNFPLKIDFEGVLTTVLIGLPQQSHHCHSNRLTHFLSFSSFSFIDWIPDWIISRIFLSLFFFFIFSLVASYWVFTQMRKQKRTSSPKSPRLTMEKLTDSCWNWLNSKYFPSSLYYTHRCKTTLRRQRKP